MYKKMWLIFFLTNFFTHNLYASHNQQLPYPLLASPEEYETVLVSDIRPSQPPSPTAQNASSMRSSYFTGMLSGYFSWAIYMYAVYGSTLGNCINACEHLQYQAGCSTDFALSSFFDYQAKEPGKDDLVCSNDLFNSSIYFSVVKTIFIFSVLVQVSSLGCSFFLKPNAFPNLPVRGRKFIYPILVALASLPLLTNFAVSAASQIETDLSLGNPTNPDMKKWYVVMSAVLPALAAIPPLVAWRKGWLSSLKKPNNTPPLLEGPESPDLSNPSLKR